MKMKTIIIMAMGIAACAGQEPTYRTPPEEIVRILDTPPPPSYRISPAADAMVLVNSEPMPPLTLLARPFHRLAGLRIDALSGNLRRTSRLTSLSIVRFDDPKPIPVELPPDSTFGFPAWSPTGQQFAFKVYNGDEIELWVADALTGKARKLPGIRLNDVLDGDGFQWLPGGTSLLVHLVPEGRGASPEPSRVPAGPLIEQTTGRVAKLRTFQDLLRNPDDERLFTHLAVNQLGIVHASTGKMQQIGEPDLYVNVSMSPNAQYLLVTRLSQPFSYRVPFFWFARKTEVWDRHGSVVRTVADLPVSDDVPPQGVTVGPRSIRWQALHPARVLWVEALDGGDPIKKVPHRDALWSMDMSASDTRVEILRMQHRLSNISFLPEPDKVLITEYDRDRRWRTTVRLDLSRPVETRQVLFDLSANDDYNDPGTPLTRMRLDGQAVVLADGPSIYLSGPGASPAGRRPFLDRFDPERKAADRLFQSAQSSLERAITFVGESRDRIIVEHQSPADPPNLFIHDLNNASRQRLTDVKDPAPELTGVERKLLTYKRADGVVLSGMLYLPPAFKPGTRLPAVVWAYPLEYSDPTTAGQVRSSPNAFTYYRGTTPLLFLTQGYAVLMDATMPVVGDPETMNETYIEQVTSAARAAVETLVEMGVADRDRIMVAGHSYGAFMTANLLAHTDLFAAGIARSGAYNRTLTPFGFQAERRSLWEAPEVYAQISPFMHAHKIKAPLLLIHGEADNNTGTFPIQSERMFQAIQGHGGTSRLVVLPFESHGYVARESVLHVLAEMLEWADRYVKVPSRQGAGHNLPTQAIEK
jgi:dipeptidyl aminopeptidase/acylaminoacyl peptidase